MGALADLETERKNPAYTTVQSGMPRIASDEMCTFLILNISSLQLIPVNMIAYRSQYGSAAPAAITAPAIIATLVSTLVGIAFAKGMEHKKNVRFAHTSR